MNATKPYPRPSLEGLLAGRYLAVADQIERIEGMARSLARRLRGLGGRQIVEPNASRASVEMGRDNARRAGVVADFRRSPR